MGKDQKASLDLIHFAKEKEALAAEKEAKAKKKGKDKDAAATSDKMDAVESKMREKMAKENRFFELQQKREEKFTKDSKMKNKDINERLELQRKDIKKAAAKKETDREEKKNARLEAGRQADQEKQRKAD